MEPSIIVPVAAGIAASIALVYAVARIFFFREKEAVENSIISVRAEPLWEKSVKICFRVDEQRLAGSSTADHPNLMREALDLIDQAIRIDDQNPRFHYTRGWILDELEEFERAIVAYGRAKQLKHPNISRTIYNIACSYSKLNKWDRALEELKKIKDVHELMEFAITDPDFANLRDAPDYGIEFNQLIGI